MCSLKQNLGYKNKQTGKMTNNIYIVFLSSEFFPMCVWWLCELIYKNETLLHIVFGTFFIYYVTRFSILINTYLQITVTHVAPHSYPSILTQSLAVRRAFRSILCRVLTVGPVKFPLP